MVLSSFSRSRWCENHNKTCENGRQGLYKRRSFTWTPKNIEIFCLRTPWGPFWTGLGGSWAPLGVPWAPVGHLLGASWARLGRSWAPLGCSWAPLGRILPLMDASGLDFGALGARFRTSQGSISDFSGLDFGALDAYSTYCMNCCKKPILAFTGGFSFPPCSAAVRAQHMELEQKR